jgi:hypothetical protein
MSHRHTLERACQKRRDDWTESVKGKKGDKSDGTQPKSHICAYFPFADLLTPHME